MDTRNFTSISDIPFDEQVNDFGTERYVNGLIRFIERSSTPITIALQGEWGSGKTSLMNRLERALCSADRDFIGVSINTWEFSMLTSPEVTVFRIMEQLVGCLSKGDKQTKSNWEQFAKKTGNFIYRATREGLKALAPGAAVAMEALNVPTELNLSSDGGENSVSLSELKLSLEEAVSKSITESGKRGVIVFVDDLDRLNPPVAVEILELLKNIFCIKNCIFVLAIDYDVVVKGLEPKFGKLSEKNEREFRSFFDKIIQVPFSLPVSAYRPMDFVLKSLTQIDYITLAECADDRIKKTFKDIVEHSVGKNPRSIKRLINTLSLLSCIAKCGDDGDNRFSEGLVGRIINFAIVAIQVCYPKIYQMITMQPDFLKWDDSILERMKIHAENDDEEQTDWEEVLETVCKADSFLEQHFNDVRSLLQLIKETYGESMRDDFEKDIHSIIDKSKVTNISAADETSELNRKWLIDRLHSAITKDFRKKCPGVEIRLKRNTGNGGFFVKLPNGHEIWIVLSPSQKGSLISLEVNLDTWFNCPEQLRGFTIDELFEKESLVKSAIEDFDKCVSPMLRNISYFEGRTIVDGKYLKSFIEEIRHLRPMWKDAQVCQHMSYKINLNNQSLFLDRAVVGNITDLIVAAYKLRVAATELRKKYQNIE